MLNLQLLFSEVSSLVNPVLSSKTIKFAVSLKTPFLTTAVYYSSLLNWKSKHKYVS